MIRRLLQRYFVTGLLTLIPIWLTWIVFKFVFQGLSMVSAPWIRALFNPLSQAHPSLFGWLASPTTQFVLGVLMTVSVILFTGWLSRRVIGKRLLQHERASHLFSGYGSLLSFEEITRTSSEIQDALAGL